MTYKDKFAAAESRAHSKGIATKISKDMTKLRAEVENSPTTSRRWIWELVQNAKDVAYEEGVNISIDYKKGAKNPRLIFRHDGKPFTADNIRFLIEQVSSKDREKDSTGKNKNSGKFGTGFLTTHMLSEKVTVKGVAKEPDLDYREFTLLLDRSGIELNEITNAVEEAKESVADLDDLPSYDEYDKDNFNTTFSYPLTDNLSHEIATHGLNDLESCLPYALAFVEEINSVEVVSDGLTYFQNQPKQISKGIQLISIQIEKDAGEPTQFNIIKLSKDFTSIVVPVTIEGAKISISAIKVGVPKLFCDFPLIGSEDFPFPVIINSPNFNPTEPRDGVYLTESTRTNAQADENKVIISEAVGLYFKLLEYASTNNWGNLHLLANISSLRTTKDWLSSKWHEENVVKVIRQGLLHSKIIRTASGKLASILNEKNEYNIWFPAGGTKEIREITWQLGNYWFPQLLPAQEDVELWYKLLWKECGKLTLDVIANSIEGIATLKKFEEELTGISATDWLNKFYKLLQLDEKEFLSIIDKKAIVPDQNGDFAKRAKLSLDACDIEDVFKDILTALGNDIRSQLADPDVEIEFSGEINQAYVIREIISEVNEKTNDREVAKSYRDAFTKLLVYFRRFPQKAEQLFSTIYRKKHLLYDDDEILDNIDKAEQFNDLLKEFNATTAEELRELISKSSTAEGDNLLPVTQEIIMSMGITSIEEWQNALKDKDLKALFLHNSVPTPDMFVYAQTHIATAKAAVIAHLQTLDEYDLSEMDDETAPTILAGIYKNGQPISIVVRPAYNYEVIIYYSSERDVLDYEPSELWIEDPLEVRKITLGHILKTAQIRKFPV